MPSGSSSSGTRSNGVNPFVLSGWTRRGVASTFALGGPPIASSASSSSTSTAVQRDISSSTTNEGSQMLGRKERERSNLLQDSKPRRSTSPVKPESSFASSIDVKGKGREPAVPLSHQQQLRKLVRLASPTKVTSKNNALTSRKSSAAPIDVVVACASGHQVANYGPGRNKVTDYFETRNRRLKEQAAKKVDDIFRGVNVWIDGFVGSAHMSDIEIKRLVSLHGGSVSNAPGRNVTHIVTSTALSGIKTQALMQKMRGWKPAVVKPEWVLESVSLGKRAAVGSWSVLQASSNQATLNSTFKRSAPTATSYSVGKESTTTASSSSMRSQRSLRDVEAAILVLDSDDE